jgi:hypothetical protein
VIFAADSGVDSGDVFWSMIAFFFMVVYFLILFQILFDLFRDHETSGWAKAAWILFLFLIPFVTILAYLIVRGPGMQKRAVAQQQEAQKQFDSYVKEAAGTGDAASQIEKAHALLDKGAISQEEFDALKAKALA